MGAALLLTQCLQNDFVRPIGRYDRLPNLLHIGFDEAKRLLGDEPTSGPVERFMAWAHRPEQKSLTVVHIRDRHDQSDPRQAAHLAQFGPHCIADTPGADFAFELPSPLPDRVHIVESPSLNDFDRTGLSELLEPYRGRRIPVGIAGVWTDAKVYFLAYELTTRYPEFSVGVCSALAASSSRAQHFIALEQLRKILGVHVVESLASFVRFLGGELDELPTRSGFGDHPSLAFDGPVSLADADTKLLRYLFRSSRSVRGRVLDGGFSGNVVLGTDSTDTYGHEEVPHVVKIGPSELIGRERASFERIESVLGNSAPRIIDFVDLEQRGAIKYRYASMDGGFSTTFQKLYMGGLSLERTERILRTVFSDQLGRFYAAAELEPQNLLEYYCFSSSFAGGVRRRVEEVLGCPASGETVDFPVRGAIPNLCRFYETCLDPLPSRPGDSSYFSYVHGDLNGANIIVDGRENVWLIDYFHTHRGHVLKDLVKLENDLLYIFTPLLGESDLAEACVLSDTLLAVQDLGVPLPEELPSEVGNPQIRRAYSVVRILRSFYPKLVRSDRDPLQWFIAAMRYAVHTLGFDESSGLQRKWALYTASRCSAAILELYRRADDLRVDWIAPIGEEAGRLGLTILPGRRDFGRELRADLDALAKNGVTKVVCLVPTAELEFYEVPTLLRDYTRVGIDVHHLPIPDQGICSKADMQSTVAWITEAIAAGERVMVHCAGGLGRSGMVAACYLRTRGFSSDEAIRLVREARSERAIESSEQLRFVETY